MLDLADRLNFGLQKRKDIASRQSISLDFMDHIIARLKTAGLIEIIRGPKGGLRLAKQTTKISVWDVFSATEDKLLPVRCLRDSKECKAHADCISYEAWHRVFLAIQDSLHQITLESLLLKEQLTTWSDDKPRQAQIKSL